MAFGRMGMVLAGVLAVAIEIAVFAVSPRPNIHIAQGFIR